MSSAKRRPFCLGLNLLNSSDLYYWLLLVTPATDVRVHVVSSTTGTPRKEDDSQQIKGKNSQNKYTDWFEACRTQNILLSCLIYHKGFISLPGIENNSAHVLFRIFYGRNEYTVMGIALL